MSTFSFKLRFWWQYSSIICIPILTSKGTTIHFISYSGSFLFHSACYRVFLPPQCTCSCEWSNCDVSMKLVNTVDLAQLHACWLVSLDCLGVVSIATLTYAVLHWGHSHQMPHRPTFEYFFFTSTWSAWNIDSEQDRVWRWLSSTCFI